MKAVNLGQALTVVAGNKIYHMAGLWRKEEAEGANEVAFAETQWIEDHPA